MFPEYDVVVVGAGHAGCEAAYAAAKMGSKVMLATMNMNTIAQMSCNPAMGGVAKGQIVREIDAMGGMSGIVSDESMVQFRMLNKSKGPAMWSPRAQSDRALFAQRWRYYLEQNPNVDFWQEMVTGILIKDGRVIGVKTGLGLEIHAKAVVLTNGTFLNGLIHIGEKNFGGGRSGERAAKGITEQLIDLGFEAGRMKTGTPPRVDGRSLDFSKMTEQKGDENPGKFSYSPYTQAPHKQLSCHITYTSTEVHDLLRTGFDRSPMFNGRIKAKGPRYCPSVEDKIHRFADKDRHQLFVEPEGWNTVEIYVNGFSTSLPEDVQYKALKKIPGFEHVRMFRPGYAIEYDYFPPTQLSSTLETHPVKNLFFAGQINGTTGYEEAACQGLIAGINAHRNAHEEEPFILTRDEAYIGVLIDDLITKGTEEPYRMFTSRAEFRILLRQDNADLRLTPIAHKLGLVSDKRLEAAEHKQIQRDAFIAQAKKIKLEPGEINAYFQSMDRAPLKEKTDLHHLLKRPESDIRQMATYSNKVKDLLEQYREEAIEQAEIQIKYAVYMEKEKQNAQRFKEMEDIGISTDFDYSQIPAMSHEAKEKLSKLKPITLGQASRISGVNPADINVLMVYLKK